MQESASKNESVLVHFYFSEKDDKQCRASTTQRPTSLKATVQGTRSARSVGLSLVIGKALCTLKFS